MEKWDESMRPDLYNCIEAYLGRMYLLNEQDAFFNFKSQIHPCNIRWGGKKIGEIYIHDTWAKVVPYTRTNPLFIKFGDATDIDFHDPRSFSLLNKMLKRMRRRVWRTSSFIEKVKWSYNVLICFLFPFRIHRPWTSTFLIGEG